MTLLHNVFELREKTVAELMIPRVELIPVKKSTKAVKLKQTLLSRKQQFLPIIEKDIDDAEYLLSLKNFFWLSPEERKSWLDSECTFPAKFIPMQCSLTQALHTMRQQQVPAMLVVDEFGRTVGIINHESIYSELVGELEDEYDSPFVEVRQTGESLWTASGMMPVFLLEEITEREIPDEYRANTINGLFIDILGRIPVLGDEITISAIKIRAEAMKRHCVQRVRIELLPLPLPETEPGGAE
jgi:CBS domain containing-hemolysin-like protein